MGHVACMEEVRN